MKMASVESQGEQDRKRFDVAFQSFVNDIVQDDRNNEEIGDAIERLKRVSFCGFWLGKFKYTFIICRVMRSVRNFVPILQTDIKSYSVLNSLR